MARTVNDVAFEELADILTDKDRFEEEFPLEEEDREARKVLENIKHQTRVLWEYTNICVERDHKEPQIGLIDQFRKAVKQARKIFRNAKEKKVFSGSRTAEETGEKMEETLRLAEEMLEGYYNIAKKEDNKVGTMIRDEQKKKERLAREFSEGVAKHLGTLEDMMRRSNSSWFTKQSGEFKKFRTWVGLLKKELDKGISEGNCSRISLLVELTETARQGYIKHCQDDPRENTVREIRERLTKHVGDTLKRLRQLPLIRDGKCALENGYNGLALKVRILSHYAEYCPKYFEKVDKELKAQSAKYNAQLKDLESSQEEQGFVLG